MLHSCERWSAIVGVVTVSEMGEESQFIANKARLLHHCMEG